MDSHLQDRGFRIEMVKAFEVALEKAGKEPTEFFGTHDWLIFAKAARGEKIPKGQTARL